VKLKIGSILSAVSLTLAITISPSFAAEKLMPIDDTDSVWIVGTDVNGYGCWSLSSSKLIPTLQVKIRGKWVTKAKAKLSKSSTLCSDTDYPWVARYRWIVDELGEAPHVGNLSRDLLAREYLPKFGNSKAFAGAAFVKQVYRSQADLMSDYASVLNEAIGSGSVSGGSGVGASSKLGGCMFKGKKLFGKVQVVDYFPDIKVQLVDYFPDLRVQKVDYFPNSCGKWQFVDYFPDIKIQFVEYFPDIKIQLVDFFPGLP
jgi:hypothetical protein